MPYLDFQVDNLVIYSPDGEVVEMTNIDKYEEDVNEYVHQWGQRTVTLTKLVCFHFWRN